MEQALEVARQALAGRRVLVTGGAGFVGSHLTARLRAWGVEVTVFEPGVPPNGDPGWYRGSVTDADALATAFAGHDIIFHLAALVGVEHIAPIPLATLEVNLEGTRCALQAAHAVGVQRFVFASSSEVYGEPRQLPIAEGDPVSPLSVYGVAKLASEAYCLAYHQERGVPATVVRLFNVYGPRQAEEFVIPIFLRRVLAGEPPIIYGHGAQSRSYTYVDDAVSGIILAAVADTAPGQVYNIGNTDEVTVQELADTICGLCGRTDLAPEYRQFGEGIRVEHREILRRQPDILKANIELQFRPQVGWREGLQRFHEWFVAAQEDPPT